MAASDKASDDSLYPIAVLIDELKTEDIQVSQAAVWKMRLIAAQCGAGGGESQEMSRKYGELKESVTNVKVWKIQKNMKRLKNMKKTKIIRKTRRLYERKM